MKTKRLFQSARPRGARQHAHALARVPQGVSIRAPAWGATLGNATLLRIGEVSIRAPAWGATQAMRPRTCRDGSFNPRARVGRDASSRRRSIRPRCFNPRARVGRDTMRRTPPLTMPKFQSARPRGARPHAHRRELRHDPVSIRAPAWGATAAAWPRASSGRRFNPRARVGRDRASASRGRAAQKFQSARPRGARHDWRRSIEAGRRVSIRAPAWGATSESDSLTTQ